MYDKKLIQVYSVGQVKNGPTVACTDDNLMYSSSLGVEAGVYLFPKASLASQAAEHLSNL